MLFGRWLLFLRLRLFWRFDRVWSVHGWLLPIRGWGGLGSKRWQGGFGRWRAAALGGSWRRHRVHAHGARRATLFVKEGGERGAFGRGGRVVVVGLLGALDRREISRGQRTPRRKQRGDHRSRRLVTTLLTVAVALIGVSAGVDFVVSLLVFQRFVSSFRSLNTPTHHTTWLWLVGITEASMGLPRQRGDR